MKIKAMKILLVSLFAICLCWSTAAAEECVNSCTPCHGDFTSVHANFNHSATLGSGPVLIFPDRGHDDAAWAYGQPAPHFDVTVNCNGCHNNELTEVHGNDCATCHPSPYDTIGSWEGGCQQGGCHVVYHEDSTTAHAAWEDPYDYQNNDCSICHNPTTWAVPLSNCFNCHAAYSPSDGVPPVTSTDAVSEYLGSARIKFSIIDNGKVGVGRTFYILDGAAQTAGVDVFTDVPGEHTLEFWSIDQNGNVETNHKFVHFTIIEDTTPPETLSNAQNSYTKATTITLSATDESFLGVKSTYYTINGGPTQVGTKVSIPGITGSNTYTLCYWSEDYAGNVENQNCVTFTVNVAATGTIRLVWWDADVNPNHSPGAGESAWWTIKQGTTTVAQGSRSGPWDGVDDITVQVSSTPYKINVCYEWWEEEDFLEMDCTVAYKYVTSGGQIVKLNY